MGNKIELSIRGLKHHRLSDETLEKQCLLFVRLLFQLFTNNQKLKTVSLRRELHRHDLEGGKENSYTVVLYFQWSDFIF